MNDDVITDLKQFISATVTQQTSDVREDIAKLNAKIDGVDTKLSAKIDSLSASVAEAIDAHDEAVDAQLKNHEQRITAIEAGAA